MDESIWLSPYQISIGEPARRLFLSLTVNDQMVVMRSIKDFFQAGTSKLIQYLPFENKLLQACQILDPANQSSRKYFQWIGRLVKQLPNVIESTDIGTLEVEIRMHQEKYKTYSQDTCVLDFWESVRQDQCSPLLLRIVMAVMVLPHGNAEVERIFSNLSDIITRKRNLLDPKTVRALIVSQSCLRVKRWTVATLPATNHLKYLCLQAHANYKRKLQEEKNAIAAEERKQLERSLFQQVAAEKKNNRAFTSLEENLKQKEKDIEAKEKERDARLKLIQEVQMKVQQDEEELNNFKKQQEKLKEQKEKESVKAAESVLKRKALELSFCKVSEEITVEKKRHKL